MVHALSERCPIRLGEAVVVQGSGPVGLAAAALAQLATAATVTLLGGPASRLELAAAVGIGDRHLNLVESDDQAAILAGLEGADLVIECTGVPHAVVQGLYCRGGAVTTWWSGSTPMPARWPSTPIRSCTGSST
jgi:threonine dehydrogenase-like Zn-dependent dehydrogenase